MINWVIHPSFPKILQDTLRYNTSFLRSFILYFLGMQEA